MGTSDCNLSLVADKYWMTGYGSASGLMPINNTLYFDFASPQGTSWSNILGPFSVSSRSAVVSASGVAFATTVQITQGTGPNASTLTFAAASDRSVTRLAGRSFCWIQKLPNCRLSRCSRVPSALDFPHLATGRGGTDEFCESGRHSADVHQPGADAGNRGARFLQAYGRWSDLEPTQGNYQIDSLSLQVAEVRR